MGCFPAAARWSDGRSKEKFILLYISGDIKKLLCLRYRHAKHDYFGNGINESNGILDYISRCKCHMTLLYAGIEVLVTLTA